MDTTFKFNFHPSSKMCRWTGGDTNMDVYMFVAVYVLVIIQKHSTWSYNTKNLGK